MALACTPENFRAEIGRHLLTRRVVSEVIGLTPNRFTDYVNGTKPMPDWAAHNIGWAINSVTGLRLFGVDQSLGVIKPKRGRPVTNGEGMGLGLDPYVSRSRRRYRRRA